MENKDLLFPFFFFLKIKHRHPCFDELALFVIVFNVFAPSLNLDVPQTLTMA